MDTGVLRLFHESVTGGFTAPSKSSQGDAAERRRTQRGVRGRVETWSGGQSV